MTQLDLVTKLQSGNVIHDLVIGGEYYQEKQTSYGLADNTVIAQNTTPFDNPIPTTFTGAVERDGTSTTATGTGAAIYLLFRKAHNKTVNDRLRLDS